MKKDICILLSILSVAFITAQMCPAQEPSPTPAQPVVIPTPAPTPVTDIVRTPLVRIPAIQSQPAITGLSSTIQLPPGVTIQQLAGGQFIVMPNGDLYLSISYHKTLPQLKKPKDKNK